QHPYDGNTSSGNGRLSASSGAGLHHVPERGCIRMPPDRRDAGPASHDRFENRIDLRTEGVRVQVAVIAVLKPDAPAAPLAASGGRGGGHNQRYPEDIGPAPCDEIPVRVPGSGPKIDHEFPRLERSCEGSP